MKKLEFTAKEVAGFINGRVEGDADIRVSDISKIENGMPGTLTFLGNPRYEKFIYQTKASIVIINQDFIPKKRIDATLIRVKDPYEALSQLLALVDNRKSDVEGISTYANIDNTARLGNNVSIGDFTCISRNVKIGNNVRIHSQVFIGPDVEIMEGTVIYPGVKIYQGIRIGKCCIVHAGAVIGADGFGYAKQDNKQYKKIPQIGNVIIEDDVEIGANACIDRASIGSTIIRRGVKLDNMVQIGHNAVIGENTLVVGLSGISGSTIIGNNCTIGGQVGVVGHIKIADDVRVGGQSGVTHDIRKKGSFVLGSPAIDIDHQKKSIAAHMRLPEMYKQFYAMKKDLEKMKKKLFSDSE
jgi:UDP-3-O-[3-hydroxymyristoyl] glucosamine N-acyltransferase